MTDQTPARPLPPVTCPGEGAVESSAMACSALHTPGRQRGADSAASPPPPQRSSPLKLGVRGGGSRSGEWRFLSDLRMSFPPRVCCQLWPGPQAPRRHFLCPWPPPYSTLYPWGREGRNTTGKRDNVRPTYDGQVPREG